MKLYYYPGACSLAPHIVLRELGGDFTIEKVDLHTKTTETGDDFAAINPKGAVPALVSSDGDLLTEGPAILQYLADSKPDSGLAPTPGTSERVRLQEWLNFITAEIHKIMGVLFTPNLPEEVGQYVRNSIAPKLAYLDRHFRNHETLLGTGFSVADAYALAILNWTDLFKIDLGPYPEVRRYKERISARESVQKAMTAEGLLG